MVLTKAIGKLIMTDQTHQIPASCKWARSMGCSSWTKHCSPPSMPRKSIRSTPYSYASDKRQFQRFVTDMSGAPCRGNRSNSSVKSRASHKINT